MSSSLAAVAKKAGLEFLHPTSDGVHHELISSTPAPNKETKIKEKGKITAGAGFNVRTAPQATAKRIGSINKNNIVEIAAKRGDWYKIKFGKGYGYIMAVKTGLTITSNNPPPADKRFVAKGIITETAGFNVRSKPTIQA